MGIEIPPEWPEILDDKWYHVFVDRHVEPDPVLASCASPYFDSHDCCYLGVVLKAWMDAGKECVGFESLCTPPFLHNNCEKITNITGPWNNLLECTFS